MTKALKSRARERLAARQALFGVLQLCPNLLLAEQVGAHGYDFLILDGEHGVLSDDDYAASLHALARTNVLAMVRLGAQDPQALRRHAEMGAHAIVVPHVSTVEEADAMIHAIGPHNEAALIVLLESALGAVNAEKILALEGVAAAFVGPSDLAADLGCQGDYAHSSYAQALARIERAAAVNDKALGTFPHGSYSLQVLRARGHRLFLLGTDRSLLRDAMSAQIAHARGSLS